jgi:hypothetical protein
MKSNSISFIVLLAPAVLVGLLLRIFEPPLPYIQALLSRYLDTIPTMTALKAGDSFPEGVTFTLVSHCLNCAVQKPWGRLQRLAFELCRLRANWSLIEGRYVPYTEEKAEITACGIPISYDASKEWADKKVVLFSVPGISPPSYFTPPSLLPASSPPSLLVSHPPPTPLINL